jgi:uncharacterized protein (TIGR03435 family)
MALAVMLFAGVATHIKAQTAAGQAPSAQSPAVPQWQTDAGGKMAFDVASVKENKCGLPTSCGSSANINLLPGDVYSPTGGLFTETNWYLMPLIVFAYKLNANHYQLLTAQLPKWANTERFDIQARASGNPTKDQFRLMMQSLLADRFKLVVHYESRQLPIFALVLDKPGRLGPTLRPHSGDPPCADAMPENAPPEAFRATIAGGFPALCGEPVGDGKPGHIHIGERNVNMERIGTLLGPRAQVGRPILDQTGLKGNFDYIIEWSPEPNGSRPPDPGEQPDPIGPTFMEALKDQLGLKLESQTGPVDVLVIDHIEELSPN